MNFTEYKCPTCEKQFEANDDIVVCPECGTPQHRDCYEKLGHCVFKDKHSADFSFEKYIKGENGDTSQFENNSENTAKTVTCPVCNAENPHELFYCEKCGASLNKENTGNQNTNQNNHQEPNFNGNFGQGQQNYQGNFSSFNVMFDPMAGLNNDEPIADGVTAGEMAKFVGKSTPYYLRIFLNIKKFNLSRFNFSAFVLSGIYFLYRKMYALGILFTALVLGLKVAQLYISTLPNYIELFNEITSSQTSLYSLNLAGFSRAEVIFFALPYIINSIIFVLDIVCALIANRTYYKHCTKKIKSIKSSKKPDEIGKTIESNGGVNLPVTICAAVIYIAIFNIFLFI